MLRLFLFFFSTWSILFSGWYVFAIDATNVSSSTDDMSSSAFRLNLCNMDPMHSSNCGAAVSGKSAFEFLLGKISTILLYFVPILAGVSLMVAGYYYILSAGDSEKLSQAKTIIKWNIVAVLIAFFSFSIMRVVQYIIS